MRFPRGLLAVVSWLGAFPVLAGGPADDLAERARRAEDLLGRAEALSGRAFDARFREAARRSLARLSPEELEERDSRLERAGLGPLALGGSSMQLVYTPVAPCRLIDTRVAGGSLAAGSIRDFKVAGAGLQTQGGTAAGCGVPFGPATAAVINFVAVNPVGPGNLRAWAYSTPPVPPPNASIINYAAVPGLNIANAIVVPICDPDQTTCPALDIRVQADISPTHLVADVVGYFERFPTEQARSFAVSTVTSNVYTGLNVACTQIPGASVTVEALVAGKVIVQAHANVEVNHTAAVDDVVRLSIKTNVGECDIAANTAGTGQVRLADGYPTEPTRTTVLTMGVFDVPPGTYTFYLNGFRTGSATTEVEPVTMVATFHPN